jgi:large subunit ribosomal protein L6
MSRVGYAPIPVPNGVDIAIDGTAVTVKGPKGELSYTFEPSVTITQEESTLNVGRTSEEDRVRALHGLTRSLLANMVTGVNEGFTKILDLVGIGYRVQQQGKGLVISVGYSHPVEVTPMDGIDLNADSQTRITVSGTDKQVVGEQAARIRSIRKPNAYTGKGIRYSNEVVKTKPGKRAAIGGV